MYQPSPTTHIAAFVITLLLLAPGLRLNAQSLQNDIATWSVEQSQHTAETIEADSTKTTPTPPPTYKKWRDYMYSTIENESFNRLIIVDGYHVQRYDYEEIEVEYASIEELVVRTSRETIHIKWEDIKSINYIRACEEAAEQIILKHPNQTMYLPKTE